jgi:broad specificity phosphatase PhoE
MRVFQTFFQESKPVILASTMKTIEHRRHATRTKPSPHLNTEGVDTARKVGASCPRFARVVTSPKKRAIETAVAMGFAIDETATILKDIPEDLNAFISYDAGFSALFSAISETPLAEKYMRKLRELFENELEKIPEGGRLLFVSHGGVVEWSALACLPELARALGNPIDKCEAIELSWEKGKFISLKDIRLPNSRRA